MPRRALACPAALFVLLLLSAACSGGSMFGPTAPSAVSTSARMNATIQPAVVPIVSAAPFAGISVGSFGCPFFQPFTSSFSLVINGLGSFFPDRVTFHFLDGSNVTSQPITFGRDSIRASSFGVFPFTMAFGCGIGRPLTVTGEILLVDGFGGTSTVSATAATK